MLEMSEIEKKFKNLQDEATSDEEKEQLLEKQKLYTGSDELIDCLAYKKDMEEQGDALYKAGSGIKGLDKIIEGFRPGNLIIVSGPTKQGKTTFCQTLTHNFTSQGYKCLWFSFDTPAIELIERFPADNIPVFYLPKRNTSEKKIKWIEEKIIEGVAKFNTRIVFVDHLGALSAMSDKAQNHATELTCLSRELKDIAMRWNLTIFLNHHLRGIDAEVIPNYSHLKDSSGPAQESDITIMVWREREKAEYGINFTNYSYISVQLHRRTGRIGNVRCRWDNNLLFDAEDEVKKHEF